MDNSGKSTIQELHEPGYKGILKIYPLSEVLCTVPFGLSVAITILLMIVFFISDLCVSKEYVIKLSSTVLDVFPNLLGFNLGCFTIILGIGGPSVIKAMTVPKGDKKFSLYQRTIAVFAFSLILQALEILIAFCITFLGSIPLRDTGFFDNYYALANAVIISVLLLVAIWSVILLIYLIFNLFSYGQLTHYYVTLGRLKGKPNASGTANGNGPQQPENQ